MSDDEILENEDREHLVCSDTERGELFINISTSKYLIIKKTIEFCGLLYLVFGIIVSYGWACITLDVKSVENGTSEGFWEPIAAFYSIINLIVFSAAMIYKYYGYKQTKQNKDDSIQRTGSQIIVLFILVPLYLISAVYLSLIVIRDISIIPCRGYLTFTIAIGVLLLLTSATMLVFEIGPDYDVEIKNNEGRKKLLIEIIIIFFTIIGILNGFFINLSLQHVLIFQTESKNSSYGSYFQFNDSCIKNCSSISKSLTSLLDKYDQNFRPMTILFCVCAISYLIQPLLTKLKLLKNYEQHFIDITEPIELQNNIEDNQISEDDKENPSFRLPSPSLVICIIFLSLSFLALIVFLSLDTLQNLSNIGHIIYISLNILIYIIGTILAIVHIEEILRWPLFINRRGKVIDNCLVWIGAGGQLLVAFGSITNSIDLIINNNNNSTIHTYIVEDGKFLAVNILAIFCSIGLIIQIFFQTVLVSLSLERRWIRPQINTWSESLCPAVGMMGLNVGLLMLCTVDIKEPVLKRSQHFFVDLFVNGIHSIGETLGSLQRLHAALLFANMIIYTHN